MNHAEYLSELEDLSLWQIENCPVTLRLKGTAHRTQGLVFCSTVRSFTFVKKFIMFREQKKKIQLGKLV